MGLRQLRYFVAVATGKRLVPDGGPATALQWE